MNRLLVVLALVASAPAVADETRLRERYGFSDVEIAALTDAERSASGAIASVERNLYARMFSRNLPPPEPVEAPFARYVNPDGSEIDTDETLPSPTISIEMNGGSYPILSVPPAVNADGQPLLVLWELDVSPSFDTPNMWRSPALLPDFSDGRSDLPTRAGRSFRLQTALESSGRAHRLQFPFRASAMRLPESAGEMDADDMFRHSRALTYGLDEKAAIAEVFNFVRYVYHWSSDELHHSPLDTFVSGLGECGYINQLAGAFLELAGFRVRGVAGFNPIARTVFPGGGHTAISVWTGKRWNYLDSYLNLRMDGPAKDAALSPAGSAPIYELPPQLRATLGPELTLSELFRYRLYLDPLLRAPMAHMHQLEDEDSYGREWETLEAPRYAAEEMWPDPITVYVRARYVDSGGRKLQRDAAVNGVFSPIGETSFVVTPPREPPALISETVGLPPQPDAPSDL